MTTIRLMTRGYLGRTLQWEKPVNVAPGDIDRIVPRLVHDHSTQMENLEISMIEIEFLDEPDVNQRFYRFGIDPTRMVRPGIITP